MTPTPEASLPSPNHYKLSINGKTYSLGPDVPPKTTLLRFIRDFACLPGTKALCHEGGCGVCTVVALSPDPENTGHKMFSVQACQVLVYACVGWPVRTIEHLGDRYDGYQKVQTALHGFYGTQCGYCTPGFVMTMYGQLETTKDLKVSQIEKALDGNICRCTGYRPILEAFKSLGSDAPENLACKLKDIEDAYASKCPKTGEDCSGQCKDEGVFSPTESLSIERNGITWYRPITLQDVYTVLNNKKSTDNIRIVVGNTGQGVFKSEGPYNVYINTTAVRDFYSVKCEPVIVLGANISLNRCIEVFHSAAKNMKGYSHLEEIAKHWEVVANVGIRNTGSWGGNMMMKHAHPGFCSDIFISLVAVDAKLSIGQSDGKVVEVSAEEFLLMDMSKRVILSMTIPTQSGVVLTSYKITPRAVNAHAYVNACFKFAVDAKDDMKVTDLPTIVLGGINPSFIRASKTEKFLLGKHLTNIEAVKSAIKILGEEVIPEVNYADASPTYRKSLSQSLLYKTILKILDKRVKPSLLSGGSKLERPISCSKQKYDANDDTWPVGQAIPKLESKPQISGEAEFLDDIPALPTELFGAFVQSTIANGEIASIDASECMKLQGVVDLIRAKDIPGKNTFFDASGQPDPIFAETKVAYAGQSIALVVAKTREIAQEAANLVKVQYKNVQKPVLTIKDSIEAKRVFKAPEFVSMSTDSFLVGDPEENMKKSKHIVEGELEIGSQFHFTMEPLAARVVPIEDGYDVYCTSQWPTLTQNVIANNLNISSNSINMSVRRLGGGYGGKISRANLLSSAAAVAACKLKTPVRVNIDLTTHMTITGWREPYFCQYKAGFNEKGIFNSIILDVYSNVGHVQNESSSKSTPDCIPSTYLCPNWKIECYNAVTDNPASTWCRTPGHVESIAIMENVIERVSDFLKLPALTIRELNFFHENNPQLYGNRRDVNLVRSRILPLLKTEAEVESRAKNVAKFNEENIWKKRGISVIPLRYLFDMIPPFQYNVQVAIYEHDGSVAISHGGIEMGQGINTKIAQVAAKILNIPLDLIKIKPTNTFSGANSFVTGGSYGSDLNAHGIKICCEKLRKRMDEVGKEIPTNNGPPSWSVLVKQCFRKQVDLCERYFTFNKEHPKGYDIWAAACLEVEIDVLTGQFLILRTDIIEDCGRSLSPYVDMGQVEGAFVMGLGLFTTEMVKMNPETGQKLSNGTWEYKPPTALDIPIDFRVSFLPKGDNPEGGVLRSKATGEPALCLSYVVVSALREAIKSARKDRGYTNWFEMDTPLTVEKIHQLCNVNPAKFEF